ncbi:phosphoglucosamine mutase [Raineyella sp.]|uniref:phosphoglucosamine mutase n=1 Tax=Raineyella sp. TaxID=1911550 RepID=UPI002B1F7605|nr:phosphoglucosamine mutase [Raineyella sp.]MEA5153423.1 phosphoglucosamine mutase [Raineyella sp.]
MGKLFGTDGIRGEANRYPMDAITAFRLGQAVTHVVRRDKPAAHRVRIVIGKDTRISGDMLESALVAGVTSMGGNVERVGVLPTPGIAYMTESMRADAGFVVSASHNPYQDNGIKVFAGTGYKLSDEDEHEIEELILGDRLDSLAAAAHDLGSAHRLEDAVGRYTVFLKNTFPRELSMEGFKVVLDTGNGATYQVGPAIFRELGAQVTVIHDEPDGYNINADCGSQHTQDLRAAVLANGANVGLAFDGDGDRLIAVDELGNEITGDQILVVCANQLHAEGRLRNDLLVSTVMSNLGMTVACEKYGYKHHAAKVGDRYVLEDMRRLGANLGGEDSGHVIFLDHHTTGDGELTALQVVATMLKTGKPLSELAAAMDVFPQVLVNIDVQRKPAIDTVPALVAAIEQAETDLAGKGRVLVRYSGTQNLCRVMVEGPTKELTARYAASIADTVRATIG